MWSEKNYYSLLGFYVQYRKEVLCKKLYDFRLKQINKIKSNNKNMFIMISIGRVCQLVAGGLSINSYDNSLSRNTPLHWAASFSDVDTINCLIGKYYYLINK